jgi:hypothetical protein
LQKGMDTQINQVVVMYRSAEKVIRPPAPSDVSVRKSIMSCFSLLFLGVVRHYGKRPFSCWCDACSRVRGRGLRSQSSGPDLLVAGCTRAQQTSWAEDHFTVTSSIGIRNRDKRVADIVVRELKRAKPDAWGCIQAHEVWSTEEEANMWTGHFWICKLGTVLGTMICERRSSSSRDASGRSTRGPGTPTGTVPSSLTYSSEMCVTDFHLAEVRPLQLDVLTLGGRRTCGAAVRKIEGVDKSTFVLSVENDNDFRSGCE